MFASCEVGRKRSYENTGTHDDEENLSEVRHIIVEDVESDKEVGGHRTQPERDRIEQDKRDDA